MRLASHPAKHIKQATEAERDRIVALIEHATEAWVEETPGSEGWAAYVTALNAARRNVEEAQIRPLRRKLSQARHL
jgi:hypothetical protein